MLFPLCALQYVKINISPVAANVGKMFLHIRVAQKLFCARFYCQGRHNDNKLVKPVFLIKSVHCRSVDVCFPRPRFHFYVKIKVFARVGVVVV